MMIQLDFDLLYPVIVLSVVELSLKMMTMLLMVMLNLIAVVDEYDDAVWMFVVENVDDDDVDDVNKVMDVTVVVVDDDVTLIPDVDDVAYDLTLTQTLMYRLFPDDVNVDANDDDDDD